MRYIRFRGMDIHGEWCFGLLSESKGHSGQPPKGFYISNSCGSPWGWNVRPETIGQYTGLKDKNGKKIYEGDIFTNGQTIYEVIYCEKLGMYASKVIKSNAILTKSLKFPIMHYMDDEFKLRYEIIGNIHENADLIKEGCIEG